MNTLWVILNEDKSAVLEIFETSDVDSSRHWPKFFEHRQGTVFCRRAERLLRFNNPPIEVGKWYVSYFYWEDTSMWGIGEPKGIAWSACMALPQPLKMLEVLE